MSPHPMKLICPRCGACFLSAVAHRDPSRCRVAWDQYVHHAQREHDLDEPEAYALVFGRDRDLARA